jgi:hypothetical protein
MRVLRSSNRWPWMHSVFSALRGMEDSSTETLG